MRCQYILEIKPLLVASFANIFSHSIGGSNKMLLWFMSKSVLPMFSSRNFLVSGLTLRSLIHFVFIFYMVWGNILISFFTFSCAVFPVPLLRRMPFPNILIYFVLISILFLLNYIWLTVLCHFLLQSIVTQLYIYIHFFLILSSIMFYPKRLDIVPCAVQ